MQCMPFPASVKQSGKIYPVYLASQVSYTIYLMKARIYFHTIVSLFLTTGLARGDSLYPLSCGEYRVGGIFKVKDQEHLTLKLAGKTDSETIITIKHQSNRTLDSYGSADLTITKQKGFYLLEGEFKTPPNLKGSSLALNHDNFAILTKKTECKK